MLIVDPRTGSKELVPYLTRLGVDLCTDVYLEFGDFAFEGNGPHGTVAVGIERKTIQDMLDCINTARYAGHQLPGLLQTYTYNVLIVEGLYRPGSDGSLEIGTGRGFVTHGQEGFRRGRGREGLTYSRFNKYLLTVSLQAGIRVVRTSGKTETAQFLSDLYHWFRDKEWKEHSSLHKFSETTNEVSTLIASNGDDFLRRVVKELPGIGWNKTAVVTKKFKSLHDIVNANRQQLLTPGAIGKTIADRIYKAVRGIK